MEHCEFLSWPRKLLAVSFPVILAACPPGVIGGKPASSQIPGSRSVRFFADQTARIIPAIQACEPSPLTNVTGTWTPSERQIQVLDRNVRTQLRDALQGHPFDIDDYFVQYFGVLNDGRHMIVINGFHDVVNRTATSDTTAWRRGAILVCDSGLGAFQADYDVKAKQLSRIRFFSTFGGPAN
jgi:hypothetical protein